jgi:hypothetical protein
MCLGCIASSAFWDAASEDQQLESPEELQNRKLELLRARLEGKPVRIDGTDRERGTSTVVSSQV